MRLLMVVLMAGLLDGAMAQTRQPPGMAEAQRLVQMYEAGKIDKQTFDEGRYQLMKQFGLQIRDTKNAVETPQVPDAMPMSGPPIPIR